MPTPSSTSTAEELVRCTCSSPNSTFWASTGSLTTGVSFCHFSTGMPPLRPATCSKASLMASSCSCWAVCAAAPLLPSVPLSR